MHWLTPSASSVLGRECDVGYVVYSHILFLIQCRAAYLLGVIELRCSKMSLNYVGNRNTRFYVLSYWVTCNSTWLYPVHFYLHIETHTSECINWLGATGIASSPQPINYYTGYISNAESPEEPWIYYKRPTTRSHKWISEKTWNNQSIGRMWTSSKVIFWSHLIKRPQVISGFP